MYQIPGLLKFPKLFHAFSTKADGNMASAISGKIYEFDQVVKNRENFLRKVGISIDSCICMWVVHGEEVRIAEKKEAGKSMTDYNNALRLDSLITSEKELYLFLNIADCLPLILFDPVKEVVGVIHAGWKGVDLEIIKKAVRRVNQEYGCKPSDLVVGIGPCARKDSYIKENLNQKNDLRWQPFLEYIGESKYKIDLVGLCEKQLTESGFLDKNIIDCYIDTVKDNRFFSHVRESKLPINQQGRFACVVGIKR